MENKNDKQRSEYFIKYIINGEKFDFNDFKTQEDFDNYKKEIEEFNKESDTDK
ncbi:hypothetical protein JOC34_000525 [Virgibacillus halotolerans]|uniref:hypothetical protein n=1 Tax=Virgibacillus halotolerans TaxID=1071053 RepID=UPI0019617330|nr:hypothetical protein [Virgibacillus halotolerans]MBM7598168.1 hypothetical protein [Virgibacillus halotolerans]